MSLTVSVKSVKHFARLLTICLLGLFASADQASADDNCEPLDPSTCSLGELASKLGIRLGSTLEDFEVSDAGYVNKLKAEFTSVTPENDLKLSETQEIRGTWDFAAGDVVVGYAESEGLAIRGHTLVWSQDIRMPEWVLTISDPEELWRVVSLHVTEVMNHYSGRIHRWDVVNEPLATLSAENSESVFWTMGSDWIQRVFDLAHSIDPEAELWINEYGTDWVPGKHDAYLTLVRSLVEAGAPIDGVGIQMHRLPGLTLDRTKFEDQLRDFTELGLKVAITELDVPTTPGDPNALAWQAQEYAKIVGACLSVANCTEITLWGLSDRDSWLDSLGAFVAPTRPLLFDEELSPKLAYYAVRDEMAEKLILRSLPATGKMSVELLIISLSIVAIGVLLRSRDPKRLRGDI